MVKILFVFGQWLDCYEWLEFGTYDMLPNIQYIGDITDIDNTVYTVTKDTTTNIYYYIEKYFDINAIYTGNFEDFNEFSVDDFDSFDEDYVSNDFDNFDD